jgi:hypothetical protein
MVRACAHAAMAMTAWHAGRLAIGRPDDSVANSVALRYREDRLALVQPGDRTRAGRRCGVTGRLVRRVNQGRACA